MLRSLVSNTKSIYGSVQSEMSYARNKIQFIYSPKVVSQNPKISPREIIKAPGEIAISPHGSPRGSCVLTYRKLEKKPSGSPREIVKTLGEDVEKP